MESKIIAVDMAVTSTAYGLNQSLTLSPFMEKLILLAAITGLAGNNKIRRVVRSSTTKRHYMINVIFTANFLMAVVALALLPLVLVLNILWCERTRSGRLVSPSSILFGSTDLMTSIRFSVLTFPLKYYFGIFKIKCTLFSKNVLTLCLIPKFIVKSASLIMGSPFCMVLFRVSMIKLYLPVIGASSANGVQPITTQGVHHKGLKSSGFGLSASTTGHCFWCLTLLPFGFSIIPKLLVMLTAFADRRYSIGARLAYIKLIFRKDFLACRTTLISFGGNRSLSACRLYTSLATRIKTISRGFATFTGIEEIKSRGKELFTLCTSLQRSMRKFSHDLTPLVSDLDLLLLPRRQGPVLLQRVITPLLDNSFIIPFFFYFSK